MRENVTKKTLTAELLNLKKRTSWSWERLSREFQQVMGNAGPSMTTLYRYAKGDVKRRNVMMEQYVQEAVQKVTARLTSKELLPRKRRRENIETAPSQDKERFCQLAEKGPDVLYRYRLVRPRGFEYISPAITDIVGYSPEEHYADADLYLRIIHPDDQQKFQEMIQGKDPFNEPVILRNTHKDGTIVWTERVHVPIYDDAGKIVAIEGIVRDITKQKRAEAKLQHLAAIVESSHDAIISSSLDGSIVSWNSAAEHLFGYTAEEMIGRTTMMIHPQEEPGQFWEMFERLLRGERLEYPDTVRVRKDGQRINVAVYISPIKDNEGELIGFSGIVRENHHFKDLPVMR